MIRRFHSFGYTKSPQRTLEDVLFFYMFESNTKEILKHLEKLTRRGHSHYRVFEDWLDLALYAFMGNDEEYLKIVGRYNNSYEAGNRDIDHFANALAELMLQMRKTNEELLGEIYMQWNNANKHIGQFFRLTILRSLWQK